MAEAESTATEPTSNYINRELSLLAFHKRVLHQATDPRVPLLERLRFLTISSSILDEFFEIRVSGLREQAAFGISKLGPDGLTPTDCLSRIREDVLEIVHHQYRILNEVLLPEMAEAGIELHRRTEWTEAQAKWVKDYFRREVFPVLTPVGLDPSHPFPRILNKSLNFVVSVSGKDAFGRRSRVAIVQAPRLLPRVIELPEEIAGAPHGFVLLTSVIHAHVGECFPGMKVTGCHQFRVTRNSDLWVDEEEVQDLLSALKGELPRRHYGSAVRLEVSENCDQEMVEFLLEQFELTEDDLYVCDGPVNLHRLEAAIDRADRADLMYPPFIPGLPAKVKNQADIFQLLRNRDLLLHHPYQSFAPVVDFIQRAANDPDVLAIKMTVYRIGIGSPMAEALLRAAESGKEVTAVVELRARFDEAANIELASRLQEAGAKVAYGVVGFKAHSKMLMVVRREGNSVRRYVHLGTGNYNARTARTYTDFGLMTSNEEIGEDVQALFQQLTGLGQARQLNKLIQTPFRLHEQLQELISAEAEYAKKGEKAHIIAKINSLVDRSTIDALYEASKAGVQIDLIVRGICCLRPGVAGLSENIRVRSVVGRFLEHHRSYYFHAGGKDLVYCGSADWMPRNLYRRVEVCYPVEGKKTSQRVRHEGLEVFWEHEAGAWDLRADGSWRQADKKIEDSRSPQEVLLEELAGQTF